MHASIDTYTHTIYVHVNTRSHKHFIHITQFIHISAMVDMKASGKVISGLSSSSCINSLISCLANNGVILRVIVCYADHEK